MKFLSTLLCTLFIGLIPYTNLTAEETSFENEPSLINSYEEDVTGDGFREYLKLYGNFLSHQSVFYPDVWLDITSPFSQQWKISLNAGYYPDIQFIDLNHDQTFDIFYMVAKDSDKKLYQYQLYTLKDGTVEQIQLPKHNFVKTKLVDDFKVRIQISPHDRPILHPFTEKNKYVENEIYQEEGKLLKEKKLHHKPIHFIEPILISEANGYGLKTYQQITGLYNEHLGEIQTLWYYKNGEWIGLKTVWVPANSSN